MLELAIATGHAMKIRVYEFSITHSLFQMSETDEEIPKDAKVDYEQVSLSEKNLLEILSSPFREISSFLIDKTLRKRNDCNSLK